MDNVATLPPPPKLSVRPNEQHILFARQALLCVERRVEQDEPHTEKHLRAMMALASVEDLLEEVRS